LHNINDSKYITKIRAFAHILIMQKNIMGPWIYDFKAYKRNKQRSTINCTIMKICANVCVCNIDIVKQYKMCCPCHFYYRQLCYPCHFIFSIKLDMSVLSISFKFSHLSSIPLRRRLKPSILPTFVLISFLLIAFIDLKILFHN